MGLFLENESASGKKESVSAARIAALSKNLVVSRQQPAQAGRGKPEGVTAAS
jgi:hypothetical protein